MDGVDRWAFDIHKYRVRISTSVLVCEAGREEMKRFERIQVLNIILLI